MKKTFICLANSKKFNERCIAGIEIELSKDGNYSVVSENGSPKWIRPVSAGNHGQVASSLVKNIKLLDIIQIEMTQRCLAGYQSENICFDEKSLGEIGSIPAKEEILNRLVDQKHKLIFGNKGKAVHADNISKIDYSLMLIKPEKFEVNPDKNESEKLRAVFEYNSVRYDLPITDVDFIKEYTSKTVKGLTQAYLAISLGVLHNDFHSKLCAGLIFAEK